MIRTIKSKKGFTLIELLIVIAIIGILAGIVLVSTGSSRKKAQLAKALSTMKSISNAVNMCIINGGNLVAPNDNGTGGTLICSTGTEVLPNISDTDFIYCGTTCGIWYKTSNGYAISMYSDSYPGGRTVIMCGENVVFSNWTGFGFTSFNFNSSGGNKCEVLVNN
ncbi:MAG: hypothetical protein ACD_8C00146G0017 [uncultured bacterium]|nr:MAG: hypothetical protein ACD_8C00146G0017 [uncultured bacterium]